MSTSEKALWHWLKQATHDPRVFLYRVENSAFSGSPDVQGYIEGFGNIFIELKDLKYPIRATTLLKFDVHNSQEFWHMKMSRLGSHNHYFLIQIEQDRYFVPGVHAKSLREGVKREWLDQFKMKSKISPLGFLTLHCKI